MEALAQTSASELATPVQHEELDGTARGTPAKIESIAEILLDDDGPDSTKYEQDE